MGTEGPREEIRAPHILAEEHEESEGGAAEGEGA